jgi:two-component system sensor histidine kinase VicK
VSLDSLELQLASALQRYSTLSRRVQTQRDPSTLLNKTLAELGTALEEVRVAQEQLIESRTRMEQLQDELRRQYEKYWQLFDEMPEAYLVSRPDSTIVEVNKAAAQLLNVSQRFLIGKTLSVFVCEDRGAFLTASARAATSTEPMDLTLKVRPRERAPLTVRARVSGDSEGLRWVLRTSGDAGRAPHDVL